jgi:hypothetical protein
MGMLSRAGASVAIAHTNADCYYAVPNTDRHDCAFVATMQFLEVSGLPFGVHMAVAMVQRESSATIMAKLLVNTLGHALIASAVWWRALRVR